MWGAIKRKGHVFCTIGNYGVERGGCSNLGTYLSHVYLLSRRVVRERRTRLTTHQKSMSNANKIVPCCNEVMFQPRCAIRLRGCYHTLWTCHVENRVRLVHGCSRAMRGCWARIVPWSERACAALPHVANDAYHRYILDVKTPDRAPLCTQYSTHFIAYTHAARLCNSHDACMDRT